ncbi:PP2C family protein-serine/threonine phosphatase [Streptoalloteichus hindustanus]|uniref:Serine/threonine protein phosphatase PrpC n=1 Tax=Streptoalloteichus hindustanus TaxID=2017 RepID=A0A1M4Z7N8_STRHI|nr:hypothetical protein [Streptoalloteichus hindustanus]SHF14034.1 Serine/threonine protein phosphatase PrpC [Streptoalloteichus hindustanus]
MTASCSQPVIGVATEKGPRRPLNADAHAHHQFHDRLAVAIVDGTGSTPEVAEFAQLAAATAVRIAARRTPVWGVMAAAELCEDPTEDISSPSGAIVVATALPGRYWQIAWAGDSAAYRWATDGSVKRVTNPHTQGELLRARGASEEDARRVDHRIMNSLDLAHVYGVWGMCVRSRLLVLASDGLHRLPETEIATVLQEHASDPEMCAQQLVKAARERSSDDITALVVPHPQADGWSTGTAPTAEGEE